MSNTDTLIIIVLGSHSLDMKSDMRHQLAEKMAGEITLSDSPGEALKKWRANFGIPQGFLAERLGVSPSVISDYESGRRKSPGTAIIGKIVEAILDIDVSNGGRHIREYSRILYSEVDDDIIYDIHEYASPVQVDVFASIIECTLISGDPDKKIYGYTVINSLNSILRLSPNEFSRIYGWSTERALIFTDVSEGKSPMVAIRVTPFKPRCVILQGVERSRVHPMVELLAKRDHITVFCTTMQVEEIIKKLRGTTW